LFRYSVGILRAVEDCYDSAYANGIEFYRRGCLVAHVKNQFSIAEFRADYSRACEHVGIKVGKRASHKQILEMTDYLNGK